MWLGDDVYTVTGGHSTQEASQDKEGPGADVTVFTETLTEWCLDNLVHYFRRDISTATSFC